MNKKQLHVERNTTMRDGNTFCACGNPWPCSSAMMDNLRDDSRAAGNLASQLVGKKSVETTSSDTTHDDEFKVAANQLVAEMMARGSITVADEYTAKMVLHVAEMGILKGSAIAYEKIAAMHAATNNHVPFADRGMLDMSTDVLKGIR